MSDNFSNFCATYRIDSDSPLIEFVENLFCDDSWRLYEDGYGSWGTTAYVWSNTNSDDVRNLPDSAVCFVNYDEDQLDPETGINYGYYPILALFFDEASSVADMLANCQDTSQQVSFYTDGTSPEADMAIEMFVGAPCPLFSYSESTVNDYYYDNSENSHEYGEDYCDDESDYDRRAAFKGSDELYELLRSGIVWYALVSNMITDDYPDTIFYQAKTENGDVLDIMRTEDGIVIHRNGEPVYEVPGWNMLETDDQLYNAGVQVPGGWNYGN